MLPGPWATWEDPRAPLKLWSRAFLRRHRLVGAVQRQRFPWENLKRPPGPRPHDVLIQALQSEEIVMQQAAIAAIGEIGDVEAVEGHF